MTEGRSPQAAAHHDYLEVVVRPDALPAEEQGALVPAAAPGHDVRLGNGLGNGEALGVSVEAESSIELSVVMPCLNEAETLGTCIRKAYQALQDLGVASEVIVADNGSTDGSQDIAASLGARVVSVRRRGYGSAVMGGISVARGRYLVIGDADDSYDFGDLAPFLDKLRQGYELVMGNRFRGEFRQGAMPALHRYVGTPALTRLQRLFFHGPVGDLNCGMRGLHRTSALRLALRSPGMEFASEMVVKASLHGLRITEVPTTLSPAGRTRPPHLETWRDGWRHLRLLLLHCPRWLFLYPGGLLILLGLAVSLWLAPRGHTISGVALRVPELLFSGVAITVGFQSVLFALLARMFAVGEGVLPEGGRLDSLLRRVSLEAGLRVGIALLAIGLAGVLYLISGPAPRLGATVATSDPLRIVFPSLVFLALGVETILSSFFFSLLRLDGP